jgi:hypothetical protein
MRDFRDAKSMAHALRDALKSQAVDTTHSESLELIAKAFGYENWNILSAKIDAAGPRAGEERALMPAEPQDLAAQTTLYCSFCGKSQHDVSKLIAGPSVYICDECVKLCTDIVRDDVPLWKVLSLLTGGEGSGNDAYAAAVEHVRGRPTDDVGSYVEQVRGAAEHSRVLLRCVRQRLAVRSGEVPTDGDLLASRRFAYLSDKTRDELITLQQDTQLALKRYEDALRIGTTVLDERGQQAVS